MMRVKDVMNPSLHQLAGWRRVVRVGYRRATVSRMARWLFVLDRLCSVFGEPVAYRLWRATRPVFFLDWLRVETVYRRLYHL